MSAPQKRTLPSGSYRFSKDHPVAVKSDYERSRKSHSPRSDPLNATDWGLNFLDSGWAQAEQAYYQGIEEGYITGLECGRREVEAVALQFQQTLQSLESGLLQFYHEIQKWSIQLTLAVAEKVIEQAAQDYKGIVEQQIRRAIHEAADRTRILVRINPADFEVLQSIRTEINGLSEGIEHFKVEADQAITQGSCEVRTPSEEIQADFRIQLSEIQRVLQQDVQNLESVSNVTVSRRERVEIPEPADP
ncbi:MAG: FliH/SctL family protein [bacterium]